MVKEKRETKDTIQSTRKPGRIHVYRSRVRMGRGSDKKANQAFEQEQKPPVNAKKAKRYGPTDGPTD